MLDNIIEPIEERFKRNRGPSSRLSVRVLLAGMLSAADYEMPYGPADIALALNRPLDPQIAQDVGLQPGSTPGTPLPPAIVGRQLRQLETALTDGWDDNGKRYDMAWFTTAMLNASIPEDTAATVDAVAIDLAAFPAWANGKLTRGQIRCADPDARLGYRSASADALAGPFLGYEAHVAAACDSANQTRARRKPAPYILGVSVRPAATDHAGAARDAIRAAQQTAPGITEVIAIRSYANRINGRTAATPCVLTADAAGRHGQIEYAMTRLKSRGGLHAHACRKHGLTAHHMAVLLKAVAHNRRIRRNLR